MQMEQASLSPEHIPSFLLESNGAGGAWASVAGCPVSLTVRGYKPDPVLVSDAAYGNGAGLKAAVFGSPVLDGRIDPERVSRELPRGIDDDAWLRRLDGEFLLVCATPSSLRIVSSRFASPPFFYYAKADRFAGAFSHAHLWRRLAARGWLELADDAFFDLLVYKRIFGDKTHARDAYILPTSTVLSWDGRGVDLRKYWRPDFTKKTARPLEQEAGLLAEALQNGMRKKLSDGARPGLFLSGGLDARTVLAAACGIGKAPTCFTVNPFENREVKVAQEAARIAGAPHVFLALNDGHFARTEAAACEVVGGLHMPMFMYLGFEDEIASRADALFHGHGLDYLFQGMYAPYHKHTLLGRPLPLRTPVKLSGSMEEYLLENASYRTKDARWMDLLSPETRERQFARLRAELSARLAEAREIADDPVDQLEYLTFYNFGRHYSFGDHWGMNVTRPQRCLTFDNDIYDVYQRLPYRYRFDARILRATLAKLNPALADLMNANHQYPAWSSSWQRTWYLFRDSVLVKLGCKKWPEYLSDAEERSGKPLSQVFREELRARIEEIIASGRFAAVRWLNPDAVRSYLRGFLDGTIPADRTSQITAVLLSFDHLLKIGEESR